MDDDLLFGNDDVVNQQSNKILANARGGLGEFHLGFLTKSLEVGYGGVLDLGLLKTLLQLTETVKQALLLAINGLFAQSQFVFGQQLIPECVE